MKTSIKVATSGKIFPNASGTFLSKPKNIHMKFGPILCITQRAATERRFILTCFSGFSDL